MVYQAEYSPCEIRPEIAAICEGNSKQSFEMTAFHAFNYLFTLCSHLSVSSSQRWNFFILSLCMTLIVLENRQLEMYTYASVYYERRSIEWRIRGLVVFSSIIESLLISDFINCMTKSIYKLSVTYTGVFVNGRGSTDEKIDTCHTHQPRSVPI